jgi:hypothetical protein
VSAKWLFDPTSTGLEQDTFRTHSSKHCPTKIKNETVHLHYPQFAKLKFAKLEQSHKVFSNKIGDG